MPTPSRPTVLAVAALLLTSAPLALHAADPPIPSPSTTSAAPASPEEQAIAQLEQHLALASAKDRCFLYTELVHAMTELAGRQLLAGDSDQANATLKRVTHYAELIHLGLSNDSKRLKNAEMLMQQTTFRMNGFLRSTSGEDRANLQAALKQLNHVEDELMTQVFRH